MSLSVSASESIKNLEKAFTFVQAQKSAEGLMPLYDLSQKSFAKLQMRGIPTRSEELWRYTNIKNLFEKFFAPQTEINVINMDLLERVALSENRLVFINGVYARALSKLPDDECVRVTPLISSPVDDNKISKITTKNNTLGDNNTEESFISLLSESFCYNGLILDVAPGSSFSQPLHFIYLSTHDAELHTGAYNHIQLNIGKNAHCVFAESFHAEEEKDPYLTVRTLKLDIAEGAHCERTRLQCEGEKGSILSQDIVSIQQGGLFRDCLISDGASFSRQEIFVKLQGEEAKVELNGVFHLKQKQQGSFYSKIEHHAPKTQSAVTYKGILRDESRGVFNARVLIPENIRECSAHQLSKNLLLSDDCEIDTKPELLISNNDVQCSHGATVAQLNPDELFYFRSRGINKQKAEDFLVKAFSTELMDKISNKKIRDRAIETMTLKIQDPV